MTRRSKLLKASGMFLVIVLMAFAGIQTTADDEPTDNGWWDGYKWVEPLIMGQYYEVGTITAWMDTDGIIHVNYNLYEDYVDDGYILDDSHVHILAGDCEYISGGDFPTTGSLNPKVGHFAYSTDSDECVEVADDHHYYEVPSEAVDYDDGDSLCLATHAVVKEPIYGDGYESQTGWAGGHDFGGKSWAMYFCFKPRKTPTIPDTITFKPYHPGTGHLDATYWDVDVTTGGDDVVPGWYDSWCVDISGTLSSGTSYTADLSIPTGPAWNKVNWILNYIDDETYTGLINGYNCIGWESIQAAIWKLVVPGYTYGTSVTGVNLNDQEKANADIILGLASEHEDFWPSGGQWMAVLVSFTNAARQEIIIEVDP